MMNNVGINFSCNNEAQNGGRGGRGRGRGSRGGIGGRGRGGGGRGRVSGLSRKRHVVESDDTTTSTNESKSSQHFNFGNKSTSKTGASILNIIQ